jgi:hypothetical protein
MLQEEVLIGRPDHLPVGFPRPSRDPRLVGDHRSNLILGARLRAGRHQPPAPPSTRQPPPARLTMKNPRTIESSQDQ